MIVQLDFVRADVKFERMLRER